MGAINRVPEGFLGLLDAKTMGRSPTDANDSLQAVLDLTPNYLANIPLEQAVAVGTVTASGISTNSDIAVPAGELWYVYVHEARRVATANSTPGAIGTAVRAFRDGGGTLITSERPGPSTDLMQNLDTASSVLVYQTPFLAAPGFTFYAWIPKVGTTGASTTQNTVLYRSVTV